MAASRILLALHASGVRRLARSRHDPRRRARRRYRSPSRIEQIERAVGDVQLLHRVHHLPARRLRLHLANACGANELDRRIVERIVELPRELPPDDDEQATAEEDENRSEGREIPGSEAETKPYQRREGHGGLLREAIAGAAQRLDQLRLEGIVDLAAQAPNEHL